MKLCRLLLDITCGSAEQPLLSSHYAWRALYIFHFCYLHVGRLPDYLKLCWLLMC